MKRKFEGLMHSFVSKLSERKTHRENFEAQTSEFRKPRFASDKFKKYVKPAGIMLGLVLFLLLVAKFIQITDRGNTLGSKVEVEKAKATQEISKEFSFPLKDQSGNELGVVRYMIEKVELMDEIIVEGKRATTVKGRTFLIVTLKITNEYTQSIDMDTRDYVRLSVEPNQEWQAPDIHNDPVQVQAISTKYTRLGFPINETDKNLILRVGEINGTKEEIPLTLK